MSKNTDPTKHNALRRTKETLFRFAGCTAIVAFAGSGTALGAKVAWDDRGEQIAAESIQNRTHEDEGSHELIEIVSLENVRPVTGYTIEHRDMAAERELEKMVPLTGINALAGNYATNKVDVDSVSEISLNLDKLGEAEVTYNPTTGIAKLKVSYTDLIVNSYEARNSRDGDPSVRGPLAGALGAIEGSGIVDEEDKKYVQNTQEELETLSVNLALQYADNYAKEIVKDTEDAFAAQIAEVVVYELGLDKEEVEVIVEFTDKDSFPEVKDQEKHNQAIRDLGGTVTSEGEQEIIGLPSTGGKA